jgi:hypothetical protein
MNLSTEDYLVNLLGKRGFQWSRDTRQASSEGEALIDVDLVNYYLGLFKTLDRSSLRTRLVCGCKDE